MSHFVEIMTGICYNNVILMREGVKYMVFAKKIKEIRLNSFLNQEEFANKLGVSFATVNRWETGKTLPNIKAMKKIDEYCKAEKIDCYIRDYMGNADCEKQ